MASMGQRVEEALKEMSQKAKERFAPPAAEELEGDLLLNKALQAVEQGRALFSAKKIAASLADELKHCSRDKLPLRLAALSIGLAPSKMRIAQMVEQLDLLDTDASAMEMMMREAMKSPREELVKLWLSMEGGLSFVIWLREVVLEDLKTSSVCAPLEQELRNALSLILSQGSLMMKRIDWQSPAALLEKIMLYDARNQWGEWGDLKTRLDKDRHLYAVFHSGWEQEPLCFLEVAMSQGLVKRVQDITKLAAPEVKNQSLDTAIFYTMNRPHLGLKGISMGENLIRQAVEDIRKTKPYIKRFYALSPIPGFVKWVNQLTDEEFKSFMAPQYFGPRDPLIWNQETLQNVMNQGPTQKMPERMKEALLKMGIKYLKSTGLSAISNPVARFHLGNGAKLDSLCFAADLSDRAMNQSFGIMASYRYNPEELEKSKVSMSSTFHAMSWHVKRTALHTDPS